VSTLDRWFYRPRLCGTQQRVSRRKPVIEKPPPRPAVLRPLGAQLRRLRQDRELTQERLAELAGLNYKYIGRVELGKADPGADVLVRLARALSVPVGDLFETITPGRGGPPVLPRTEVETITTALQSLTSAVERLFAGQPRTPSPRSGRRGSS
jgi:transcriptional regulator with XRE-family HTH domain